MAQRALGAGMIVPRKRALFGLLDADGWAWAGVKAFVWLVIIILMLGYIPDRAYYLTVNRTVDLGVLAWSPINLCPPENETLPCPAPVGAVAPWHESPPELRPARRARTDGAVDPARDRRSCTSAGRTARPRSRPSTSPSCPASATSMQWTEGPPLPEPRSDASVIQVSGTVYVLGGYDEAGEPTTTVFSLTPDPQTGDARRVGDRSRRAGPARGARRSRRCRGTRPGCCSSAARARTARSRPPGEPVRRPGQAPGVGAEAPLLQPQADATAAIVGDHVWLYGGHDANGPVATVQRGDIGLEAAEGFPENPDRGQGRGRGP